MKNFLAAVVLLGFGLSADALTNRQESGRKLARKEALGLVRTINAIQAEKILKGTKFSSLDELLKNGSLHPYQREVVLTDGFSGNLKDYKLSIIVSADGQHYQTSLRPVSGCDAAFFSSESGLVYEGWGLGCPKH